MRNFRRGELKHAGETFHESGMVISGTTHCYKNSNSSKKVSFSAISLIAVYLGGSIRYLSPAGLI